MSTKRFPVLAITFSFRLEFAQKTFFKLKNFFYIHARDQRLGGGNGFPSVTAHSQTRLHWAAEWRRAC